MSISAFQLLSAPDAPSLQTLVTTAIAGGKHPIGGLVVGGGLMHQAVVTDAGASVTAYAIASAIAPRHLETAVAALVAGGKSPLEGPVLFDGKLHQATYVGTLPGASAGGGAAASVSAAVLSDTQAANTNGGSLTDGAWNTRVLNTEDADPSSIVTLASNQFTLGAGTYVIDWSVPGFNIGNHLSRLYNVTGAAAVKNGSSETSSASSQSRSMGSAIVTPTGSTAYRIEHQGVSGGAASTAAGQGPSGTTGASVFTVVRIVKLA
jgi:hypothetical protein